MRYAVLLIVLWPLVCCEKCDYTPICIVLSVGLAVLLHVALSIVHELRLLAARGQRRYGPY